MEQGDSKSTYLHFHPKNAPMTFILTESTVHSSNYRLFGMEECLYQRVL